MSDPREILETRRSALSPAKQALLRERLRGRSPSGLPAAIPRRAHGQPAPLSFAQQRLWFLDRLEPGSSAYNEPAAVRLEGPLDRAALEGALSAIVARHEILRTVFLTGEDDEPRQVVLPAAPVSLREVSAPGAALSERTAWAMAEMAAEARRPFELASGPSLRVTLFVLSEREAILFFVLHHIACDGWSMGILLKELAALYAGAQDLPQLELQYADYAQWDRDTVREGGLGHWKERLRGELPVLSLPIARPRPAMVGPAGDTIAHVMPRALWDAIQNLAADCGATPFMIVLAAFDVLLARYAGLSEVMVGTPHAGRDRPEVSGLIGFFVNTLVLRTDVSGAPSFRALIDRVRETCLSAYAHADTPFERLVEALHPTRDLSRPPLIQVELAEQPPLASRLWAGELMLSPLRLPRSSVKFDQEWHFWASAEGLEWFVLYSTELFERAGVARMIEHLEVLLSAAVADPDLPIDRLTLMSASERHRVLVEHNDTTVELPVGRAAHQIVEDWAQRRPQAIACRDANGALGYAALNARANRIGRAVARTGAGRDQIVAILAPRSNDFLAAILGVQKAGAAYLPLDPRHPPARWGQILEQSGASLLLADPAHRASLFASGLAASVGIMDFSEMAESDESPLDLERPIAPEDLAYVIYTSGSTGRPKGAMVEHRGMLNHLFAKVLDLELTDRDTVAQNASQCFDISVWQFLAALMVGGTTEIIDDERALSPDALFEAVEAQNITVLEVVPSMLRAMLESPDGRPLRTLRWMIPTGEALPPALAREWLLRWPHAPMINAYGPTECSDDVTHHLIRQPPPEEMVRVPIGRPIANMRIYILDRHLEPVPTGVPGELYVGGIGVGRGYLHQPELTEKAFLPDPFAETSGARLYRTGDLGRRLDDGTIEFLGRNDHQVKVRGFRIELEEIETVLARHPAVRAVLVTAYEARGDTALAAYVVSRETITPDALRAYLAERLPDYMVPGAFVVLDAFPLNANGKIDRSALPSPEAQARAEAEALHVPPRNATEVALAAIWCDILALESVGAEDDFFKRGGHSLLAVQLTSKIRRAMGVELPLRTIFARTTLSELAEAIELARRGEGESLAVQIDFEREGRLEPDVRPSKEVAAVPPDLIVLTGATGFFGAFLLRELLRSTRAQIACLVRAPDAAAAMTRLEESQARHGLPTSALKTRVIAVPGDLALPRLGLDVATFDRLAAEAGAVIHNGAWVNFAHPYARLRAANVDGTCEALRLAAARVTKPFHFVSTIDVFGDVMVDVMSGARDPARPVDEEAPLGRADRLATGYAQSKWVAERRVEEARGRGLPVTIFRPGVLAGDTERGVWNEDDLTRRLIRASIELGRAPNLELPIDLTPVDHAAEALVAIALAPHRTGHVFHLLDPDPPSWPTIVSFIREYGYRIDDCDYSEWVEALRVRTAAGLDPALAPLLELLAGGAAAPGASALRFGTESATRELKRLGVERPRASAALLRRYLDRWVGVEGLAAP